MAYRNWHSDGGRPPPPPYSRHRHSTGASSGFTESTTTTSNTFTGDSKFTTELFKDMSAKIAHLTKVVCTLTNKNADQELVLESSSSEYDKKVKKLQSDLQQKTEDYKNKIRSLELLLQEEKRHSLKKEEEIKVLKQFRALVENWRFFSEPLIRTSKDKTSISSSEVDSEDIRKFQLELGRRPGNLYCDSKLVFTTPNEAPKNGGSEFTFIGDKLRDMESYEKEVRLLIDACEKLRAEKMAMRTKYESDFCKTEKQQSSQATNPKGRVLFSSSETEVKCVSEINLKEQLEKQDLQYRKRISELLQCLTQSESRSEKHRKEVKQLEETLASKEKQNSLIAVELSKNLEYLKQSRNANTEIQEVCNRKCQEIQIKNDLIKKLEDERNHFENQLSLSRSEIEDVRDKLKEYQQENVHLHELIKSKETALNELFKDKLASEQKKYEELRNDFESRIQSIHNNHSEEKRKLEEKIEFLIRSSLQQERAFFKQMEDTKVHYELHMEEERVVQREIQDNLEQQLDLLHRNVQHTIRNEEEEVATLHLLLGDKEASLNKTQKQLKEAREIADRMMRLIKLKEMELEKVREQQKIHHSTEVRFTVENSPISCNITKKHDEYPVIFAVSKDDEEKQKTLQGKIQLLEEQNKILKMEKEEIENNHLFEIEKQKEAHKEELEKLKLAVLPGTQNGEAIFKKLTEGHCGNKAPREISGKENFEDYSLEIESYRELSELQEALEKTEDESHSETEKLRRDLSVERDHVTKLSCLVEKLQAEHGRVIVEREAKMNEVLRVRSEASQQIKNLENYWQERLVRELKKATHSFENEKQKLISHFNKGQRLLKDKIVLLQSIMKDLKDRKSKHEVERENMEAFQELHKTIEEKDATISKLKEEKKALHIELINQRGNSLKAYSSQTLASSIENMFALKKPRLEKPPLTPQLIRRHSLLGSSEQKWLRARSQSPMRGFPPECSPKSTHQSIPVHRSSWTGEMSSELPESLSLKNVVDNNTKITTPTEELIHLPDNLTTPKEQPQIKAEQDKFSLTQQTHESLSNHICDTIAECDELLMTIEEEEKQSTFTLKEEKLEVKDWAASPIMESEV